MGLTTSDPFGRLKALQRPLVSRVARASDPGHGSETSVTSVSAPEDWVADGLGGEVRRNASGEYLAVSRWFAEPAEGTVDAAAWRLLWPDGPDAIGDPQQWLFLDTETTGLAGGTGTYPFLVGLGWWDAGGIQVEQLFMRDLNEEWPVLAALAQRLEQRPVLVTFNGKSFDWPLLETRYRMTRVLDVPAPLAHLDFLHPARHLWRLRLGSVRLALLERQVLGYDRGEDLVSELIPSLYLEFLRGGRPQALLPVLRHNQMDLCGLAALSIRVLSLLADPASFGGDGLELYGVSRLHERRGYLTRARELYACSIASSLPAETDRAARISLARLAKRQGDYPVALELWEDNLGNSREGLQAYEQLAIHYEHRAREPQRALEITREALAELRRAHRLGILAPSAYRQAKTQFEHRLARLERKSRRAPTAPLLAGRT